MPYKPFSSLIIIMIESQWVGTAINLRWEVLPPPSPIQNFTGIEPMVNSENQCVNLFLNLTSVTCFISISMCFLLTFC